MADANLSTSISAIRTKILNDTPTATVDELVSLSRAAKSIGLTEDTSIETAINSRANTLSSNATTNDMVKLSNAIKQLRNTTAGAVSPSTTSDDIVEGTSNLYYTDARTDARIALNVANLVDSAPATLDTLNELAAALGDDANFATTVTNSLANITNVVALTHTGELSAYTGTKRWYAPKNITISKIKARVDTAPTGAGIVIQVNRTSSGVTTNQQLTVADGTTLISDTSPTISSMSEDDFLTIDIVSVGSTVAGENLTVEITYK
jgi:hypothetical protein